MEQIIKEYAGIAVRNHPKLVEGGKGLTQDKRRTGNRREAFIVLNCSDECIYGVRNFE